jgi:hypothetical protein
MTKLDNLYKATGIGRIMQRLRKYWVELVFTALTLIGVALFLSACSEYDKLPVEHFNDELYTSLMVSEYGIAIGNSMTLYTIYGTYETGNKKLPAGLAVHMDKINRYPIKEIIEKYPNLAVPQALEAAKNQKL